MTTGTTTLLSLALPVEGELDGTWGDVVNYGITDYVDIAVAGTLTLNGDGAVTLVNTSGDAAGTNIGATTAQYAVIKITGTLTTTKVITAPSSSKTYIVDNAATGGAVTFKASGQTGVSVAVAEKCTVYYNGTDYVKVASSVTDGVSTISFGSTGLTPSTATSGAVTVAGTLAIANGGTGITSFGTGVQTALGQNVTGSGSIVLATSPTLVTPALGTPSALVGTNITGTAAGLSIGGNAATATSAGKVTTSNFTIEESGGNLIFKYGATTIASMTSAGVFTTLSDINGNGTP